MARVKSEEYLEHEVVNGDSGKGLDCSVLPSRAKQEFAEEVDINTIVRRFGLTGELPVGVPQVMQGDFTTVMDFRGAMDMIVKAREMFAEMPAEVRAEFDNDPAKFLDFTSDPKNKDRAIELGLVRPEVVEAAMAQAKAAKAKELADAVAAELAKQKAAGTVST